MPGKALGRISRTLLRVPRPSRPRPGVTAGAVTWPSGATGGLLGQRAAGSGQRDVRRRGPDQRRTSPGGGLHRHHGEARAAGRRDNGFDDDGADSRPARGRRAGIGARPRPLQPALPHRRPRLRAPDRPGPGPCAAARHRGDHPAPAQPRGRTSPATVSYAICVPWIRPPGSSSAGTPGSRTGRWARASNPWTERSTRFAAGRPTPSGRPWSRSAGAAPPATPTRRGSDRHKGDELLGDHLPVCRGADGAAVGGALLPVVDRRCVGGPESAGRQVPGVPITNTCRVVWGISRGGPPRAGGRGRTATPAWEGRRPR